MGAFERTAGTLLDNNRYQLTRKIGGGGMAEVWEAMDLNGPDPTWGTPTLVAVKFMNRKVVHEKVFTNVSLTPNKSKKMEKALYERFTREVKTCMGYQHPSIIRIHFASTDEYGTPYYVMDLVEGRTLETEIMLYAQQAGHAEIEPGQAIEHPIFPYPEMFRILDQVLDAVEYTHQRGGLHRDLKPSNIMITRTRGRVSCKIIDFGVVRVCQELAEQGMQITQENEVVGTLDYMPLEQLLPRFEDAGKRPWPVGPYSDVYAIGVILFQMVTGQAPYGYMTMMERVGVLWNDEPVPHPLLFVKSLKLKLIEVMERAIAKKPWDRYQTTADFRAALREAEAIVSEGSGAASVQVFAGPRLEPVPVSVKPVPPPVSGFEPTLPAIESDPPPPRPSVRIPREQVTRHLESVSPAGPKKVGRSAIVAAVLLPLLLACFAGVWLWPKVRKTATDQRQEAVASAAPSQIAISAEPPSRPTAEPPEAPAPRVTAPPVVERPVAPPVATAAPKPPPVAAVAATAPPKRPHRVRHRPSAPGQPMEEDDTDPSGTSPSSPSDELDEEDVPR